MRLEDEEIDYRLRSAVEPDPQIIDRVVRSAMAAQPRRGSWVRIAGWAVLAVAVYLAIVFVGRKSPNSSVEGCRLEYVGDLAVFEYPDGSTCLLTPDVIDRGPQSRLNLIIVGGDKP